MSPKDASAAKADTPARPPDRATVRRAKAFIKDVERMLKKHGAKVEAKRREKVEHALGEVKDALQGQSGKRLSTALKELDGRVEQSFAFAKKTWLREYSESIIVAVLIAFVLRAFVLEAFKIPTESMVPTLTAGDHIFVNKFIYGLRIPLTDTWLSRWAEPERGDVIVFRFPQNPSKDYIKRVVAVPGDNVHVEGRDVFVNGQKLDREEAETFSYVEEGEDDRLRDDPVGSTVHGKLFQEQGLEDDGRYSVLYDDAAVNRAPWPLFGDLPGFSCHNPRPGHSGRCKVKEDWVYVMGDNRDHSSDSRVWGGVPRNYVKGRAMFVWWSRGPRSGIRWARFFDWVR